MSDEFGMNNGKAKKGSPTGDLGARTKEFALRVVRVYESLPKSAAAQMLGRQVLRSGTSVGAHYREACRARSTAAFRSKIEVGLQALDETSYWLELLIEGSYVQQKQVANLVDEAGQLTAMLVASTKPVKARTRSPRPKS
jgi:four helix bundle protein